MITKQAEHRIFAYYFKEGEKLAYQQAKLGASAMKKVKDTAEKKKKKKTERSKYEKNIDKVFVGRLKETNEFIGVFAIHHVDTKTPELGVWTKLESHGNGYGLEGMTAVKDYAFEHVDFDYLIYPVDRRNYASRNIPQTIGGFIRKEYKG